MRNKKKFYIGVPAVLAVALWLICGLALNAQDKAKAPTLKTTNGIPQKANTANAASADPFYAPPQFAATVEAIHFGITFSNRQGQLEFAQPLKRQFQHHDREYLVAIDNDIIGDGGEAYTHAWFYIYNRRFKEWRCFQTSHFTCVAAIDAELDSKTGQIEIRAVLNGDKKGAILATFNLVATSDDAAYIH
jgi:hypothetical protein